MPNEGKSVEQVEKEFRNKFNIAYVHDKGWAFLREEVIEFYRSALSAVVLGAAEKAMPDESEWHTTGSYDHKDVKAYALVKVSNYRSALTAYAQVGE